MQVDRLCTCDSLVIDIKVCGIIGISEIEFFNFPVLTDLTIMHRIFCESLEKYVSFQKNFAQWRPFHHVIQLYSQDTLT